MISRNLNLAVIFFIISVAVHAQNDPAHPAPVDQRLASDSAKFVWVRNETADIFPEPVDVKYGNEYVEISDNEGKTNAVILASGKSSLKAANVFNELLSKYNFPEISVAASSAKILKNKPLVIKLNLNDKELSKFGDQAYSIRWKDGGQKIVEVSGSSEKG